MFESPADKHIAELIEYLCGRASRCNFHSDADTLQTLVDQIAQLRASQTPTIQMPCQ